MYFLLKLPGHELITWSVLCTSSRRMYFSPSSHTSCLMRVSLFPRVRRVICVEPTSPNLSEQQSTCHFGTRYNFLPTGQGYLQQNIWWRRKRYKLISAVICPPVSSCWCVLPKHRLALSGVCLSNSFSICQYLWISTAAGRAPPLATLATSHVPRAHQGPITGGCMALAVLIVTCPCKLKHSVGPTS